VAAGLIVVARTARQRRRGYALPTRAPESYGFAGLSTVRGLCALDAEATVLEAIDGEDWAALAAASLEQPVVDGRPV
jgi:hypothetical protein